MIQNAVSKHPSSFLRLVVQNCGLKDPRRHKYPESCWGTDCAHEVVADGVGGGVVGQCVSSVVCWSIRLCCILLCLLGSLAFLALAHVASFGRGRGCSFNSYVWVPLGLYPFGFFGLLGVDGLASGELQAASSSATKSLHLGAASSSAPKRLRFFFCNVECVPGACCDCFWAGGGIFFCAKEFAPEVVGCLVLDV
jgi:hypothetical protein